MTECNTSRSTVGILYPGEMGSRLGKLLHDTNVPVITTVQGRSSRTCGFSREAGLNVVGTVDEILERSDILISLVSPAAALSVATEIAASSVNGHSRRLLYIDANSISPMTVARISEVLGRANVDFVDASIFGLASQLRQRGTVYLSGTRAKEVSDLLEPIIRVKVAGEVPGQASALKMIVSGIPKGLSALFLEAMLFAREMHLLNEALQSCDEIYPSIMEVVRRMLPTYPQHAARRSEEVREAEETMLMNGSTPRIVHAVQEITSALAGATWPDHCSQQWTIEEMIEEIHTQRILRPFMSRSDPVLERQDRSGARGLVEPRSALPNDLIKKNSLISASERSDQENRFMECNFS